MAIPFFHSFKSKVKKQKPIIPLIWSDLSGFNGKLAVKITNAVSTMWCAYLFAGLALVSLPNAISTSTSAIVSWVAQTFLQLVLLSVIMVGQKVSAKASDRRALQTFNDAEAILKGQSNIHDLIKEIHEYTVKKSKI